MTELAFTATGKPHNGSGHLGRQNGAEAQAARTPADGPSLGGGNRVADLEVGVPGSI